MNTESVVAFGHNISQAWEVCTEAVVASYKKISDEYESVRQGIIVIAREKLHGDLAYLVEKIASAIPEIFIALSALWASVLTVPTLLVSLWRYMKPLSPMMNTVWSGDMTSTGLGEGIRRSLDNCNRVFEEAIVPALFVAFVADSVYSFTIGWLSQDCGQMLHATAIAVPGAFLTFRYMMHQRDRDCAQSGQPIATTVNSIT